MRAMPRDCEVCEICKICEICEICEVRGPPCLGAKGPLRVSDPEAREGPARAERT